jgi:asparaginyl-tRNA synthetase
MVEPEVAFLEFDGLCELAEDFVCSLVSRVLDRCRDELAVLERDTDQLEKIGRPFPHITYTEAIEKLNQEGHPIEWGEDFGAEEETNLVRGLDRPLMVSRFPAAIKAFYMEPDPDNPELALALDVLAPEGYGEIIGGSQRIHDRELLEARILEHDLPREAFEWYLDVRRYGTFPHSGFGMGIERFIAWICGAKHLRETIPYPRLLYRIYP